MKDEAFSYEIRWAKPDEWKPAMLMVWRTFYKFEAKDYSPEGIQNFYDFISDPSLYNSFLRGQYQLMIAVEDKRIIGMGSLRNINHLSLLFVDEEYHHRQVGSSIMEKLCDYLKNEMGTDFMSLTSSPYAVEFYKHLGFETTGGDIAVAGITVTPMEKYF